ncbi:hypothetical protein JYQ62_26935 [Nostoc sp. UHCC 0702]|nr:hypothetical protein JYQ62_26935 [Nostoc sp. UHCC 0702]
MPVTALLKILLISNPKSKIGIKNMCDRTSQDAIALSLKDEVSSKVVQPSPLLH